MREIYPGDMEVFVGLGFADLLTVCDGSKT